MLKTSGHIWMLTFKRLLPFVRVFVSHFWTIQDESKSLKSNISKNIGNTLKKKNIPPNIGRIIGSHFLNP